VNLSATGTSSGVPVLRWKCTESASGRTATYLGAAFTLSDVQSDWSCIAEMEWPIL